MVSSFPIDIPIAPAIGRRVKALLSHFNPGVLPEAKCAIGRFGFFDVATA